MTKVGAGGGGHKNSPPIKYTFKTWICEEKNIKIYTLLANLKLKRERTNKPKEKLLGWQSSCKKDVKVHSVGTEKYKNLNKVAGGRWFCYSTNLTK